MPANKRRATSARKHRPAVIDFAAFRAEKLNAKNRERKAKLQELCMEVFKLIQPGTRLTIDRMSESHYHFVESDLPRAPGGEATPRPWWM